MTHGLTSLIARRVRFYSAQDEDNFFAWLNGLDAIKSVSGEGDGIVIECDMAQMTEQCLRELIALFYRYGVETKQLDVFLTSENASWFLNQDAFWRRPPSGSN